MQLMSNHNTKPTSPPTTYHLPSTNRGFTLVEMLIIAPIVILVIGIFVSAIITMTGDVLAIRGKNALAFNIQDALNRIDQDVKSSGGYLSTNNITLTSPQGFDNGTAVFKNADATNGTMLILNTYATTSNPLSSTRSYVYTTSGNVPIMMNVIYYVKTVNGVSSLWRRVITPLNYATMGSSVPWQQPTCVPGYIASFCKTQDMKLVDGVSASGFVINYYTSAAVTTPIANAINNALSDTDRQTALQTASSINVTISATKTLAGRDVSQSGTIRTVNLNSNLSSNNPPAVQQSVSILVVAGGGGGGGFGGGGGGGYQYDATHSVSAKPFSVTVGDGGGGAASGSVRGTNGGNSIFDTTTATGGGGGGAFDNTNLNGANGGSGGGAGTDGGGGGYTSGTVGLGTSGQGHNGGLAVSGSTAAGGGGGAGAVGGAGVTTTGGNGGAGTANSISGASVTYAGGGGASGQLGAGIGGNGGGGNGGINSGGSRTAGTANTGGGGGGGYNTAGMAGGSGIVIIKYLTGSISATGGTITYVDLNGANPRPTTPWPGGYTVHTFIIGGTFTVS